MVLNTHKGGLILRKLETCCFTENKFKYAISLQILVHSFYVFVEFNIMRKTKYEIGSRSRFQTVCTYFQFENQQSMYV